MRRWFEKRKSRDEKDESENMTYTVELTVNNNFGTPGAIVVTNRHQKEFYLESIAVEGFASGIVHFNCNSWIQSSSKDAPRKRVFFSDKVHPSSISGFVDYFYFVRNINISSFSTALSSIGNAARIEQV